MTSPRIYVACLASYNNGTLHGKWIDAAQDADDIQTEIRAMLRESKYPNVEVDCHNECDDGTAWREGFASPCPVCKSTGKVPSAEEWAVHDYEGFEGIKLGEYPDLETVSKLADLLNDHEEAFAAFYQNGDCDGKDPSEWEDHFTENY